MRIAGYPHQKAVHCGSGTLASALAHRGLVLSEPMVFGLGAGLGFALHEGEPPQQASRFFVGRSPSFEEDLCASLGAELAVEQYDKPAAAWTRCCELVAQGKPALVYTDLFELPYMGARNHWYGHLVAVIGHEGDEAIIADNERPEALRALAEELPEWNGRPDADRCFRLAAQVIEQRGTGGGLFRRMYAQFLEEAGLPELVAFGVRSADAFSALAERLAPERARACAEAEEALWKRALALLEP